MNNIARMLVLVGAALSIGAVPGPTIIPYPGIEAEALIVPASSPVKFRGWDKASGYAQFQGRFVLSGKFHYGCWSACADYEGPVEEEYIDLRIEPDPAMQARLPHWKKRKADILVVLDREERLAQLIAGPRQHAALRSGRIESIEGRTSVVVDNFQTGHRMRQRQLQSPVCFCNENAETRARRV